VALLQLAGGIELDIASGAELRDASAGLGKLIEKGPAKPLYLPLSASATGVGGVVTLDVGTPPVGRVWSVRAVTFLGNNDHSSVASPVGFCAMYFGDPFNPSLSTCQHCKIVLPSTVYPSTDALWCPAGQRVFFVTDLAVNAPDQVLVNVVVAEFRTREVAQESGR
jgi:hypothetical protein